MVVMMARMMVQWGSTVVMMERMACTGTWRGCSAGAHFHPRGGRSPPRGGRLPSRRRGGGSRSLKAPQIAGRKMGWMGWGGPYPHEGDGPFLGNAPEVKQRDAHARHCRGCPQPMSTSHQQQFQHNGQQKEKAIGLATVREPLGEAKTPQTGTALAMHQTKTKTKTKSWCPWRKRSKLLKLTSVVCVCVCVCV